MRRLISYSREELLIMYSIYFELGTFTNNSSNGNTVTFDYSYQQTAGQAPIQLLIPPMHIFL